MKELKFRCHYASELMTDSRSKTNLQKYNEVCEKIESVLTKMDNTKNKETKTYSGLEARLEKYKAERDLLEPIKDIFTPSETCKKRLRTVMIEYKFNRRKRMENKYTRKGLEKEEEAITLLGKVRGLPFTNNKKRVEVKIEDFFSSGEIDVALYDDEEFPQLEEVIDIKNRYDIDTLFDNEEGEGMSKSDYWQLVNYLLLHPIAKRATIANVLLNNTYDLIQQELRSEEYKWNEGIVPPVRQAEIIADNVFDRETFDNYCNGFIGATDVDNQEYKEYIQFRKDFVEIPLEQRIIQITIERNKEVEADIEKLRKRLIQCRGYLKMKYGI